MADEECRHEAAVRDVTPSARSAARRLKTICPGCICACRTCGHVGCCDDLPNRHATKCIFTNLPPDFIEGYDPPEGWGWC